ncbi:MAG: hypothetical protein KAZ71_00460 [Bacteroidia bacterium]|nr:hypothetical protein [Bacteroidia bacterium]
MEKYIYNRKPLSLLKNKEFNFNIPVSIDTKNCEFIIECADFNDSKFEIIVKFNLGRDSHKFAKQITLKPGCNIFDFNDIKIEEQDKYILYSCIASESINLALTIKESVSYELKRT